MANIFVRSTDGNDADDGTTWALADATLTGAAAADSAGDVIWVSQVHAESTAGSISFNWAGTAAAPTRVICGDDAAEPPTALATTATVTATGSAIMSISSGADYLFVYGITFNSGTGASSSQIALNQNTGRQVYENCNFNLGTTEATSIIIGNNSTGITRLVNCGLQFSATSQSMQNNGGKLELSGGSVLADAAITTFTTLGAGAHLYANGFDFSNCAAAMNICANTSLNVNVKLRNCKMPASWSGSVNSSTPGSSSTFELFNSDSADTNYRLQKKTEFGEVTHETTIVGGAGATDGTTAISWKMVSNADAEWNHQTLDSPEIVRWNETTGSAITATIEIVHDSVTNITDQQIWMEVQYLGTSGTPLSLFVDDAAADYITAAADQADSTASWTTTGLTNPNTQKLNVTFTPQEKGFIHAVVKLAQASKTVYVDPKITVS